MEAAFDNSVQQHRKDGMQQVLLDLLRVASNQPVHREFDVQLSRARSHDGRLWLHAIAGIRCLRIGDWRELRLPGILIGKSRMTEGLKALRSLKWLSPSLIEWLLVEWLLLLEEWLLEERLRLEKCLLLWLRPRDLLLPPLLLSPERYLQNILLLWISRGAESLQSWMHAHQVICAAIDARIVGAGRLETSHEFPP